MKKQNKKRNFGNLFLFIIILAFDQITKLLVKNNLELNNSIPIIKNVLNLTYITNTGAAFGTLQNFNLALIFVSFIAIGLIAFYWDRIKEEKIFYVAILAGIFGNLIDRLVHGFVIDFINFNFFPAFNVADSAICIGVLSLLFIYWKKD